MSYTKHIEPLRKSKSLISLGDDNAPDSTRLQNNFFKHRDQKSRTISDSSMEITAASDSDADDRRDSGVGDRTFDSELQGLESKIDKLSEMFLEQCRLLSTMKEEFRSSRALVEKVELEQNVIISELLQKAIGQSVSAPDGGENSRAKCLLAAIESSRGSIDCEIRDVLVGFLQSEELKERMVQATAESVRDVIGSCVSRDVSALYLPVLERSQRRLLRHVARVVDDAFKELEEYSSWLSKSVYKTSRSLHRAVERHRALLDAADDPHAHLADTLRCTVEELLSKELKQWRQKVLDTFSAAQLPEPPAPAPPPSLDYAPPAAPQPVDPDKNIIDLFMESVEISKQISSGDMNGAFERALSAADLSLVTRACRAARGAAFAPRCRLRQPVLLALLQQLSTDMLHDTQLKCRYLEDSIINLDCANPATRSHLPLVVGEVRKHLSKFLASYPSHVASRRVSLIIMAADNLLK